MVFEISEKTKEVGGLGGIISIFILIIIGTILAGALADSLFEATNTRGQTNETTDITAQRATWNGSTPGMQDWGGNITSELNDDNLVSLDQLRHSNGTILTVNIDYTVNLSAGTFILLNSSANRAWFENITLADYHYKDAEYVDNTISRTLLTNLVLIFFITGMVVFVAGYVMKRFYF